MKALATAFGFTLCLAAGSATAAEFEPRLTIVAPEAGRRVVALTFDACSGGFDRRIMDALVQSNARATIFVTDRWLRKNAAAFAELKARPDLFEIENHGLNHAPAVTDAAAVFGIRSAATIEGVRAEIEGGAAAIEAATGARPLWFRGATARYTRDALDLIASEGLRVAGFSVNADMGASLPAHAVKRRFEASKSGAVLIAHINQPGRPAGQGAADGVRALAKAGVRFVRLDEAETRGEDGKAMAITADHRPGAGLSDRGSVELGRRAAGREGPSEAVAQPGEQDDGVAPVRAAAERR